MQLELGFVQLVYMIIRLKPALVLCTCSKRQRWRLMCDIMSNIWLCIVMYTYETKTCYNWIISLHVSLLMKGKTFSVWHYKTFTFKTFSRWSQPTYEKCFMWDCCDEQMVSIQLRTLLNEVLSVHMQVSAGLINWIMYIYCIFQNISHIFHHLKCVQRISKHLI